VYTLVEFTLVEFYYGYSSVGRPNTSVRGSKKLRSIAPYWAYRYNGNVWNLLTFFDRLPPQAVKKRSLTFEITFNILHSYYREARLTRYVVACHEETPMFDQRWNARVVSTLQIPCLNTGVTTLNDPGIKNVRYLTSRQEDDNTTSLVTIHPKDGVLYRDRVGLINVVNY